MVFPSVMPELIFNSLYDFAGVITTIVVVVGVCVLVLMMLALVVPALTGV
jgi:hypothetical protein